MTRLRRCADSLATLEAERGVRDLEDDLLWAAEIAHAPGAGQEFAARFGWASPAQRKELARTYAEHRLEHSRQMINRVADRAHALQAQHERRWQRARSRVLLALLLGLAAAIFAAELFYARS